MQSCIYGLDEKTVRKVVTRSQTQTPPTHQDTDPGPPLPQPDASPPVTDAGSGSLTAPTNPPGLPMPIPAAARPQGNPVHSGWPQAYSNAELRKRQLADPDMGPVI